MKNILTAVLLLFNVQLFAQAGVSSATMGLSRQRANDFTLPAPDQISVEELINYHKHNIPAPKGQAAAALSIAWSPINANEAIVQIGIRTPERAANAERQPLNLALVVDCSGSMSEDFKMAKVKDGLLAFAGQLQAQDRVAVIMYSSKAEVVLPNEKLENGHKLNAVIRSLPVGGGTNLHGGLMLGFQEVFAHFDSTATNRVLLLTDGIANEGVTDTEQILADAAKFWQKGIDLTTIGVGYNLNHSLMKQLAQGGRGLYHFIADPDEVQKVFIDEAQSLTSPIARNVELAIDLGEELELVHLFGYQPQFKGTSMVLKLEDLNYGATLVVMAQVKTKSDGGKIKAKLAFFDAEFQTNETLSETARLNFGDETAEFLAEPEVRKNYAIAALSQAILEMSQAFAAQKPADALRIGAEGLAVADGLFPAEKDADLSRVYRLLAQYRRGLKGGE